MGGGEMGAIVYIQMVHLTGLQQINRSYSTRNGTDLKREVPPAIYPWGRDRDAGSWRMKGKRPEAKRTET